MDELIEQVSQRTGLSPDRARTAVDTVVGYLEKRLPDPIGGQLRQAVSGNTAAGEGGIGDIAKGIGDTFGRGA